MALIRAICEQDDRTVTRLLAASPELVRQRADDNVYLDEIAHYLYGGDTALHVAAAAYRVEIVRTLIGMGSDVCARNRRGAQPLHYAADGAPGSRAWDPAAQATTIALLLEAGADPHAVDRSGVMPLHRAVRTRSAAAVGALLEGGADPLAGNGRGSTAMDLATRTTGRGGSGSAEAKAQQREIVRLLEEHRA